MTRYQLVAYFGLAVAFAYGLFYLAALVSAGKGATPPAEQVPGAYLSLGDSLAFGEGAHDPAEYGFAPLVHAALQPGKSGNYAAPGGYINLGRQGGETSSSMLSGGQLQLALAEVAARRQSPSPVDDVSVITLSIGGNDLFLVLSICGAATFPLDPASVCGLALAQGYTTFAANFDYILGALQQATSADVKIAVLSYFNSLPACNLAPFAPLAELALEGDGATIPGLNGLIRNIADVHGVRVAEGHGLLTVGDFAGGTDCRHPNDSGHAKLAAAFLEAFGE